MTVPTTIDAGAWLGKYLEAGDADTDLPRAMLAAFAEALMSAQASMQCNAGYGERTDERENSRNGYRVRPWDTRVGTVDLAIPKLRQGVYSPEFLLQPRRRAEQALIAVVCQAYVEGVSTRRVDDLVKAMGIEGISKSEVSRMAAELDQKVAEFRDRPLDAGPYRYLWIDALTQRVREGGRVVNVSAVIATACNAEGRREIVGFDIVTTEDTEAWTAFLRSLVARGLSGVELIISDAHGGIKAAIGTVFAEASWQRCRTHFMANLASRVPKTTWPMIATLVRSIFEQPDRETTWSQLGDVVDKLTEAGFNDVAVYLLDAADDILAFSSFPVEHWQKIRSNNPQERLNKEIRRRTDVVGIFPNRKAVIRLVGALLAEQTDEWAIAKRYMGVESLRTDRIASVSEADPRPAMDAAAG
ncbi:MAG: IS256 family transposase [Actinomycetota bacterium]|nr:IS256 family transposase [Actinomycetota bacterium]